MFVTLVFPYRRRRKFSGASCNLFQRYAALFLTIAFFASGTYATCATSAPDLRIIIAFEFFQSPSMPDPDVSEAKRAMAVLADGFTAPGYRNYFIGCYRTAEQGCPNARIAVAVVFGDRVSETSRTYEVQMISRTVTDERAGTSLAYTANLGKGASNNPLLPSDAQLQTLLGVPVLSDGAMAIAAYSPYMQLVPDTATDRKYVSVLQHFLLTKRIQAVPSQFTGLDTTNPANSGTATGAAVCNNSPRYLHYNVNIVQRPRPLEFKTVMHVESSGQVIDCVNPASRVTFGDDWDYPVATTKNPLSSFVGLLGILFVSKTNSWTNVTTAGASFSSIVDVDPSSTNVEQDIYDRALLRLVGEMCVVAQNAQNETTAHEVAVASTRSNANSTPAPTRHQKEINKAGEPQESQAGTPAQSPTQSLGIGGQSLSAPPVIQCAS